MRVKPSLKLRSFLEVLEDNDESAADALSPNLGRTYRGLTKSTFSHDMPSVIIKAPHGSIKNDNPFVEALSSISLAFEISKMPPLPSTGDLTGPWLTIKLSRHPRINLDGDATRYPPSLDVSNLTDFRVLRAIEDFLLNSDLTLQLTDVSVRSWPSLAGKSGRPIVATFRILNPDNKDLEISLLIAVQRVLSRVVSFDSGSIVGVTGTSYEHIISPTFDQD